MAQPPSYPNKTGYTQTMVPNSKETDDQLAMAPPAFYVLANGGMPGFNHVVPSGYNQVPIVAYLPISIRGDASGLVQSTSCSCNRSSVAISSSKPSPTELVSDDLHIVSTSTSAPDQPQYISPYTRPVSLALSDTPTFSTPNTASPDAPAFPVPEVVASRRRSRPNPITIPPPNAEFSCYSATQAYSMPPTALVYPKQQSLDIFGESNKPAQSLKALLSTKLGSPYSLLERPTNPTPGELPSMYVDKQTGDISPAGLESLLKSAMRIKDEEKHRRALADGVRMYCAQEEEKEKERVRKYEAEQTRLRTFYLQHNEKADSLRKAWRRDLKQLVQLANATLAEDGDSDYSEPSTPSFYPRILSEYEDHDRFCETPLSSNTIIPDIQSRLLDEEPPFGDSTYHQDDMRSPIQWIDFNVDHDSVAQSTLPPVPIAPAKRASLTTRVQTQIRKLSTLDPAIWGVSERLRTPFAVRERVATHEALPFSPGKRLTGTEIRPATTRTPWNIPPQLPDTPAVAQSSEGRSDTWSTDSLGRNTVGQTANVAYDTETPSYDHAASPPRIRPVDLPSSTGSQASQFARDPSLDSEWSTKAEASSRSCSKSRSPSWFSAFMPGSLLFKPARPPKSRLRFTRKSANGEPELRTSSLTQ